MNNKLFTLQTNHNNTEALATTKCFKLSRNVQST